MQFLDGTTTTLEVYFGRMLLVHLEIEGWKHPHHKKILHLFLIASYCNFN